MRTTVIVGHPGEDDKAFDELLEFIRDNQFDNLGAFMFSAEAGTVSAGYPDQIPAPVARRRLKRVMKVQKGIVTRKNRQLIGSVQKVLVHGPCDDHDWVFVGRTAGQAPEIDGVTVLDGYDNELGPFLDVTITRAMGYDLVGEPLPVSLID